MKLDIEAEQLVQKPNTGRYEISGIFIWILQEPRRKEVNESGDSTARILSVYEKEREGTRTACKKTI